MTRILLLAGLAAVMPASAYEVSADSNRTNLSLTALSLGVDGPPCKASKTFWRTVEIGPGDNAAGAVPSDMSDQPSRWKDSKTGKVWRLMHSWGAGESATVDKLVPGDYRVTAALGPGQTPFGVSEVIHLDGSQKQQTCTIRLLTGPSLTVTARDARTRTPLEWFRVCLEREDGFPVTQGVWSRDGQVKFDQLPPGTYRLTADRTSAQYGWPEYAAVNGPTEIEIGAGKDQEISVPLAEVKLSEEVVRQRWPFVVQGRVTDERGQGLEGVAIGASCGFGSILPTGATTSGPDGRYTLRFHGDTRAHKGVLQPAIIGPAKPGYVEANLSRQGDLLLAGQMPEPGELTRRKSDPTKVVLPEQAFAVDFVMVPAATLKGQLVDAEERPMARQRIYLCGDELPPAAGVLAQVHTDADGRFQFDNVPPRRAWWFSLPDHGGPRSQGVTVERAVVRRVHLRLGSRAGKPALEVSDASER